MKLSIEFRSIPHVYRDTSTGSMYRAFQYNGSNAEFLEEFGIDDYEVDGKVVVIDKYRLPEGYWLISQGAPNWEIVPNSYMSRMELIV